MRSFEAYLSRIGLSGAPTLPGIHRAHVTSIPFENLDPWLGQPVSLDAEDLERKLVAEHRGGYCFEQNLLLKAALHHLDLQVQTLLGRARTGAWPGPTRPRTHMVLRVEVDGEAWLADVGFGSGGLLDPVPFRPGGPYEQSGWLFRLVEDGAELVLQAKREESWVDRYGFAPAPVPLVDLQTANWFASTYPDSPFVRGPIVSLSGTDGTRTSIRPDRTHGLVLIEQTPTERQMTRLAPDTLTAALSERFGIDAVPMLGQFLEALTAR